MADSAPGYTLVEHTASDGYRWQLRRYSPEDTPRARVVCIHGIQSHAGWYEYSCTRLGRAGFTVDFLDRRGSGVNRRNRGDTPSFRRLLDDLAEYLAQVRKDGGVPVFLLAISWGGKLAVALQRYRPGLVDGLVLLCPGFFSRVKPPFFQRFRILGARLLRPTKRFPIPLNDPAMFTGTPHWQKFIQEEPSGLRQVTARMLIESVRLDYYLRFVPRRVSMPVLLLLAENDRIIDNAPTRRFVERFATSDKEIIEYAGAHHTLEFEPEPDRFVDDVRSWLERHLVNRTQGR